MPNQYSSTNKAINIRIPVELDQELTEAIEQYNRTNIGKLSKTYAVTEGIKLFLAELKKLK